MKIATTTSDFKCVCNHDHAECIRKVAQAGFKYIDISLYEITENDPLLFGDNYIDYAKSLNELAQELGVKFVQAHSPRGNLGLSEQHYAEFKKLTDRAIEICGILGIPNMVVHPGISTKWSEDDFYRVNTEFYKSLTPLMEKHNVNVLTENCDEIEGYYTLSSAKRVKRLIDSVNHPMFHTCWDTGHANLVGPQYDEIVELGKDLYALHINDNRGELDEHIIPFFGTMNMDEVINALIDINYSGYFTFECGYALRPADLYFGDRRRFEKDTRLLDSTLDMQVDITKFLFSMGRHILDAYNLYEE